MSVGIDKTLAMFVDLQALAVDSVTLAKKGPWGVAAIFKIFSILNDVQALAKEAPAVLPELQDLDAAEAGAVGAAAFTLVKAVITAVAA